MSETAATALMGPTTSNGSKQEAIDTIMDVLIRLPWEKRREVFRAVQFNGMFCTNCGHGEVDNPNPWCQCDNDE